MEYVFLTLLIILFLAMCYILSRNNRVNRECDRMIKRMEDAIGTNDFNKRIEEYHTQNQIKMVFTLWRPVKSFYKDFK